MDLHRARRRRLRPATAGLHGGVVLAVVAGLLAIALAAMLVNAARSRPRSWPAASGTTRAGPGGPDITTDQPGTYEGIVHVRADGSIQLRASGDIRLRIDGLSHIVASAT